MAVECCRSEVVEKNTAVSVGPMFPEPRTDVVAGSFQAIAERKGHVGNVAHALLVIRHLVQEVVAMVKPVPAASGQVVGKTYPGSVACRFVAMVAADTLLLCVAHIALERLVQTAVGKVAGTVVRESVADSIAVADTLLVVAVGLVVHPVLGCIRNS